MNKKMDEYILNKLKQHGKMVINPLNVSGLQ